MQYETGVIHGRFQILHNDHLSYIMSGWEKCKHLVIGITNPDPLLTADDSSDLRRSNRESNPLTYYERYQCVRSSMKENKIAEESYSIVPFPINFPDKYRHYVPMNAVYFLTIYDDWGRKKQEMFESLGLKVHILRNVDVTEKGLSSTYIRELIRKGEKWEHLVPGSVADLLNKWVIARRV